MNTRRILITALLLTLGQTLRSQTDDPYIACGRGYLAATNLAAANICFSNAVAVSPGDPTGNVFYAATRLLTWPIRPVGSNFLNRIGVPNAGRDIYNWTAQPPTDTNGVPLAPTGVNANEFSAMLRTNLLTELIGAEANLAKATDTTFTLSLTSNETRTVAVTLDYGDIRLLRAMLQAAEYYCYTACSWNLDAQLAPLYSLYSNNQFSAEDFLRDHPSLLTFATTNDLATAKAALQAGVNRYFEASQFIRSRATNVVRLFNYDPEKATDEANFRQTLTDLTNSLTRAVTLNVCSNYTVFLGSQFSGTHPLRPFLPVIRGNGFGLGTLPDPTFGGLIYNAIPGIVEDSVEEFLARGLFPIPTIAPGLAWAGLQFQFPINTLKNRGYAVEVSTNLHDWTTCYAFFSFADGYAFADTNAYNIPRRFYRIADRTENMPPPLNDNFANRIPLTGLGITTFGYNASATTEPGEPGYPWNTVWWSWTAPVSGMAVVQTVDTTTWHDVEVYTGTVLANLSLVARYGQPFYAIAGTTYQIQVGGEPGGIRLVITAPPTLTVSSPQDWAGSPVPTNITISASAADSGGHINSLAFYTDDALFGNTTNSSLSMTWSNVGVGSHSITVTATDNLGISASSNLFVYVSPPNDNFANRTPITSVPATVYGTNTSASREPGEPDHAGDAFAGSSVWWSWTSPFNGYITISADMVRSSIYGYHSDALLGVYTGTSVSNLTSVASSTSVYGGPAQVSFMAVAGVSYQIAVDSEYYENPYYFRQTVTLKLMPTRPPSVSITSPMNGSMFVAPANITITANATDNDGSISRVDFYMGTNSPSLIGSTTNFPFSTVWSITSNGSYDLVAKATDNMGASTYSAPVNVAVYFPETVLTPYEPIVNLFGQRGSQSYYRVTVPPGCQQLQIQIDGGTGDCDLYVAFGYQPSLSSYEYRPYMHGNYEYVYIDYPTPGDWHIMLNGWDAYAGVTLQAAIW
jgi:hypothetical protein